MASEAQILTNLDFLLTAEPAKSAEKETKVKKEKILKRNALRPQRSRR